MKLFKIFREKPEETQLFPPEEYTPVIRMQNIRSNC